jgi:hypothetical protein
MKRVLAILAFLAGGISVEIANPLKCSLIASSQARIQRRRLRYSDGK